MENYTNQIIVTPEFWTAGPVHYNYLAPDGTLWNVGRVQGDYVQLWTINAWGSTYYQTIPLTEFRENWKEYNQ